MPDNSENVDQLEDEESKNLKPLTKQSYSKIHALALSLYGSEENANEFDKFKQKNVLILHDNPTTATILLEEFQMTSHQFLKYLKVIGCRTRSFERNIGE